MASAVTDCVDSVRSWIGQNHKTIGYTVGGIFVTVKVLSKVKEQVLKWRTKRALEKWEEYTKENSAVIVLHTLPRGKTVPNLSPFAMKLETYLRMAELPYEVDFEMPWGPVQKTPWITVNGQHIHDSQIIIDFLRTKHKVTIGRSYSEERRAVGKAVRIMMDEYLYWGIGLWRYVYSNGKGLDEIFDMPPFLLKAFYHNVRERVTQGAWAQGVGRHSQDQVIKMMEDVLRTASSILGERKFLLGDKICEEDASLFGFLSMVMWAAPGSPYEKYLEELPNLKQYCLRMKELFWSDWEECLAKKD